MPVLKLLRAFDMANAYEFALLRKEAYENAGVTVPKIEMLDYAIDNQLVELTGKRSCFVLHLSKTTRCRLPVERMP